MKRSAAGGLKTRFKPPLNENESNSNVASVDDLRQILKKKTYRIWPIVISRYLREDKKISSTAKICWQILYELSFFSENLSLHISKSEMASRLGRSPTQVGRIFNQLEKNHYIIRILSQNKHSEAANIKVRFPANILQKSSRQPDRASYSNAKRDNPSIYVNIINNNRDTVVSQRNELVEKSKQEPVVFDLRKKDEEKVNRDADNQQIETCKKEIQKIDTEIRDLKEILKIKTDFERLPHENPLAWMARLNKNKTDQQRIAEERSRTLEIQRDNLSQEILRTQNRWKPKPEKIQNPANLPMRSIESKIEQKIKVSLPEKIANEIVWNLKFGHLPTDSTGKSRTIEHSANIFLKVAREGRWETPKYLQKSI